MKTSQPALYNPVRNKLKLWKLSESQINQIETSGKVRENFPIYATVSGTVSQKMEEEGDYVKQGQPIVKVSDLGTVWAIFDAYENQISQLKEGQKIKVTTKAYPNKEFDATVSFIDPTLNTKSRTVSVRATLNNKDDILKPGMFVTATVQMSKDNATQSQITVPATAVLWTGSRSSVYVKTNPNEPVFEMREVTLGTRNGNVYTIVDGLKNGEEVVTNGTFTVDTAAQLQGKKSMMNAKGSKTTIGHEGHSEMESTTNTETKDRGSNVRRLEVSSKFQTQLQVVFDAYIAVQNALAKDNPELAKQGASKLLNKITEVNMELLKDNTAHTHWMRLEKELNTATSTISSTSDIKKQREHFIHLSAHLLNALKTFGINQKVYVDFCPMANNNVGVYWLSKEQEIRNPYFGNDMLDCGSVTDEID